MTFAHQLPLRDCTVNQHQSSCRQWATVRLATSDRWCEYWQSHQPSSLSSTRH